MAQDARHRIVPEHACEALYCNNGTYADDHHAGVPREAHAHATAVVAGDPGRTSRCVQQGIQQRPVGDGTTL